MRATMIGTITPAHPSYKLLKGKDGDTYTHVLQNSLSTALFTRCILDLDFAFLLFSRVGLLGREMLSPILQ